VAQTNAKLSAIWSRLCCCALSVVLLVQMSARADDLQTLRDRIVQGELPGDRSLWPEVIEAGDKVSTSMQSDGSWKQIDYTDQTPSDWKSLQHLRNLLQMAKAYAAAPSRDRADQILLGLRRWLKNDPRNPNWWHNQIGVPELLGETAMLLGDALDHDDRAAVVQIMKRSNGSNWTGQNQIWGCGIQISRGVLEKDETTVQAAFTRLYREVRVADSSGDGIMPDNSFHQHGPLLYSGGYGLTFANDIGRFVGYSWGTKFQIPKEPLETYLNYLLDGERWMTRGRTFDYSAIGREITRRGRLAVPVDGNRGPARLLGKAYGLPNVCRTLASLNVPRHADLAGFADQLEGKTLWCVSGNRHFWCSDYMTHQRPGFFASLRMFSSRTLNSEIVNGEGRRSQHQADGSTLIYRDGDEYSDIFPVWNWKMLPGTTAEQYDLGADSNGAHVKGEGDFVGGVSDGVFGVAAQDLIRGDLKAKKFWMFLDDGFVALGSGIECSSENAVVTTLNQCLAKDRPDAKNKSVIHNGLRYQIDSPQKFQWQVQSQSGRWSDIGSGSKEVCTRDVFTLWIDHGAKPRDAGYQYTVSIESSPAPDIEVLANTPQVQACRSPSQKVVGIACWSAGKIDLGERHSIEVDRPCMLLLRPDALSISNPRNAAMQVNVTIDQAAPIRVELPDGRMAGSTVTLPLTTPDSFFER
jgi:chondroitin AC lyase